MTEEPKSWIGVKLYYHGVDENGDAIFLPYSKNQVQKYDKAPAVMQDTIDPWVGHATQDTPVFTSRKERDLYLKQHGFAIKEPGLGYGKAKSPEELIPKEKIRNFVEKAYYDEKYQRVPHTEKEKEAWKQEERAYKSYRKRRGEKVK